jgi:GNAT superfamily N-acetyltransferase
MARRATTVKAAALPKSHARRLKPDHMRQKPAAIEVRPVTPERWADLVDLFERPGPRGGRQVSSGCWCMFWRLEGKRFDEFWGRGDERGEGNKRAMRRLVRAGSEPGLMAYIDGRPVGWCSVGPREAYPRLDRSRSIGRVDDQPVWSVACFYIHRSEARQGVGEALLAAAVEHAARHGARIVEGYPVAPGDGDPFTGFRSMFEQAGFHEVRAGGRRSIVRYEIRRVTATAPG